MNITTQKQDFTVKQVSLQLQTSIQTIRKAIKKGLIKTYKISERNTQKAIDDFKSSGGFSA